VASTCGRMRSFKHNQQPSTISGEAHWRGRPLTSLRTIVELISATATTTGLTIQAAYDPNWYPKGVKINDVELAAVPLDPQDFHGEWNYTINAQSDPA
jgi:Rhodopirellula transposase DDE domain